MAWRENANITNLRVQNLDLRGSFSRDLMHDFFVDATNGSATNDGTTRERATTTIAKALDFCTASRGDIIWLMPGHAETISAAAGLALDVAGVSIIGVGNGALQPTITFDTANTADMDVDAANVLVENVHFRANFADIAAAIDVNADDFTMRGCRFSEVATNMNAKIWIQDAAATASDRITVEDCHCVALDAANTHFINFAGTPDGCIIRGNTLIGDWGTMCIGGAGVVTNIVITDNIISNAASTNDSIINLDATATGIVMRNLACGAAAQANGVTATACAIAENYYGVVSEDLSAILDPIAT
jgi:hypothetical protein